MGARGYCDDFFLEVVAAVQSGEPGDAGERASAASASTYCTNCARWRTPGPLPRLAGHLAGSHHRGRTARLRRPGRHRRGGGMPGCRGGRVADRGGALTAPPGASMSARSVISYARPAEPMSCGRSGSPSSRGHADLEKEGLRVELNKLAERTSMIVRNERPGYPDGIGVEHGCRAL